MADKSASPAPLGDAENTPIITHIKKKSNTFDENNFKKIFHKFDERHTLPNVSNKANV